MFALIRHVHCLSWMQCNPCNAFSCKYRAINVSSHDFLLHERLSHSAIISIRSIFLKITLIGNIRKFGNLNQSWFFQILPRRCILSNRIYHPCYNRKFRSWLLHNIIHQHDTPSHIARTLHFVRHPCIYENQLILIWRWKALR